VTASLGVACARPSHDLSHDLRSAEIVAGADAALYAAKRSGRNQVQPRLASAVGAVITKMPARKAQAR
jgi:PleD family two-component response regulator